MWIAAGFATAVLALVTAICLIAPRRRPIVRGSWPELRDYIGVLCERRPDLRGLRIELSEIEGARCRVMRDRRGLRLDVAATSQAERSHEGTFRRACAAQGVAPEAVINAVDRQRWLTAMLPYDGDTAGQTIAAILAATYAADPEVHIIVLA